jgi:white-opaque regulator 2
MSCQTRLQPPAVSHSSLGQEQELELHSQRLEEKQARQASAQLQHLPSPPQPSDAGSTTSSSPLAVNTTSGIANTAVAAEAYDVASRTSNNATNGSSTDHEQAGHNKCAPAIAARDLHETRQGTWTHCASSSPSPTMSNTQPPPGPPRQHMGYPNQAAYPPAPMPPAAHYAYPPQPPHPHGDVYRGNPPVNNPMTLPNIRSLDPMQPQHTHGLPMVGTMAPSAPPLAYYNVPPPNAYMHQDPNGMRYALPPNLVADPRIALSGGRHKKVRTLW